MASLTPEIRARLNRFFDVGFTVAIDRRFQSAEALMQRLVQLTEPSPQEQPGGADDKIGQLLQRLATPALVEKQQYHSLLTAVSNTLRKACDTIWRRSAGRVGTIQTGHSIDLPQMKYVDRLGLYLVVEKTRQFRPEFEAVIAGSELVVTGRHGVVETELLRTPVAGPQDWDRLHSSAVAYLTDGLVSQCSDL